MNNIICLILKSLTNNSFSPNFLSFHSINFCSSSFSSILPTNYSAYLSSRYWISILKSSSTNSSSSSLIVPFNIWYYYTVSNSTTGTYYNTYLQNSRSYRINMSVRFRLSCLSVLTISLWSRSIIWTYAYEVKFLWLNNLTISSYN